MKKQLLTLLTLALLITFGCKKGTEPIKINATTLNLKVGQQYTFSVSQGDHTFRPEESYYTTENITVVAINSSGRLTAMADGKTRIKVEMLIDPKPIFYCDVTVTK